MLENVLGCTKKIGKSLPKDQPEPDPSMQVWIWKMQVEVEIMSHHLNESCVESFSDSVPQLGSEL